jgi:hypothetical protein
MKASTGSTVGGDAMVMGRDYCRSAAERTLGQKSVGIRLQRR